MATMTWTYPDGSVENHSDDLVGSDGNAALFDVLFVFDGFAREPLAYEEVERSASCPLGMVLVYIGEVEDEERVAPWRDTLEAADEYE